MATPFPAPVNTFQVGSYFLNNYYQILQNRPDMVYQFYASISTMVRLDSYTMEASTATGIVQIHRALMCLNLNGIEVKSAHFLDSWNGGILVTVSGLVQQKDYGSRRRFVQTFFLAPQEKGYFVLNDIFYFLDDEHDQPQQAADAAHYEYETNMQTPSVANEPGPNYSSGEVQSQEFVAAPLHEESDAADQYGNHEVQNEVHLESEPRQEETPVEEPAASYTSSTNSRQDAPAHEEETGGELPKQTYASVLRAKAQSTVAATYVAVNKPTAGLNDMQSVQQSAQQSFQYVPVPDKLKVESFTDASIPEDDDQGEFLSVYVGNLSPSTSIVELEREFRNFGRIRPDSVAIRSRKEAGVFYGFVEFEDITGVQNALKASPIDLNGRLIHVEERRPNSGFGRGGRRGRGRGGYPLEAARGRSSGRPYVTGLDDRDYMAQLRGNGYQRRGGRRDGTVTMNQTTRNEY